MKNIYIILLLSICFSVNAQLRIGARGGISISNLEGNSEQSKEYTSRQALYGGLFLNFRLTHSISVQPEINFSPQDGQRNGIQSIPADAISGISLPPYVNLYANFKREIILNYLEIPVLMKFTLGHKLKYYACFGPQISFYLRLKPK